MSDNAKRIYDEIEEALLEKYHDDTSVGCYVGGEWFSIDGVLDVVRDVLRGR